MTFTTIIEAISPVTGELTTYRGPFVEAYSWEDAERKAPGYCRVDGEFLGDKIYIFKHELN